MKTNYIYFNKEKCFNYGSFDDPLKLLFNIMFLFELLNSVSRAGDVIPIPRIPNFQIKVINLVPVLEREVSHIYARILTSLVSVSELEVFLC